VGYGSIGKRHSQNLKDLGHDVFAVDIGDKLSFDCDCAFICSPTQYHADHAVEYIRNNIPVFIEKPITYSLRELEKIERAIDRNPVLSMVGCNLRFHPSILKAKTIADTKKVVFARAETGYYLPFWRQSDYKKSYSASEYGGIVLDAIHEPDYLYWLFGNIKDLKIVAGKVSDLEVKKEDIAEIAMLFEGLTASVHCNYLMKNYHRTLDLYMPHEVISFKIQPTNIMYKKEIEYLMSCLAKKEQPMNGVKEATYVLKKILAGFGDNTSQTNQHSSSR
jgi:predicted dehydrogenase